MEARSPFPWTMLLSPACDAAAELARRHRARYGRGARILSVGIATTGLVTFAYFSLASHALSEVDYKGISLLWSVMFVIISIIYRPVEQLLSRTISARRARGLRGRAPAADRDARSRRRSRRCSWSSRWPCATQIQDDVFDGARRCTGCWSSACSPTR